MIFDEFQGTRLSIPNGRDGPAFFAVSPPSTGRQQMRLIDTAVASRFASRTKRLLLEMKCGARQRKRSSVARQFSGIPIRFAINRYRQRTHRTRPVGLGRVLSFKD